MYRHARAVPRLALLVLLTALLAAPAGAAGPPMQLAQASESPAGTPVRIRGRIVAVEPDRLVVSPAGEAPVTVSLREPLGIVGVMAAELSAITGGSFVGTAARRQPDGTLRALEVHIFPEAMRGVGEGHRPMNLPETTMTNAGVEEVVERAEGRLLVLKHPGGEVRVLVPPDAPVVRLVPGDRGLLQSGAPVSIGAVKGPDGALSSSRITVGIDVVPPM
jgi:hypothetical protein